MLKGKEFGNKHLRYLVQPLSKIPESIKVKK
jgi:hypothetical protein